MPNLIPTQWRFSLPIWLLCVIVVSSRSFSQQRTERTLDEIKTEAIKRAENGMYPLIGLDLAEVREAFQSIKTKDKDEWAAAFMGVADRYMSEAKSLEKGDPQKANADYIRACAFILSAVGRCQPRRANSVLTPRRSKPFSLMPDSGILRSRWCTSRLKTPKSPVTCAFRKTLKAQCHWSLR